MSVNSQLIESLASLQEKQFTGVVTIKSPSDHEWKIYLYLGMLLWTEGGCHGFRFWQRHLSVLCPQAKIEDFAVKNFHSNHDTDYYLISILLQKKLVKRELVLALIEQRIVEVFFDILQEECQQGVEIIITNKSAHYLLKFGFNFSLPPFETTLLLAQANQDWINWTGKGLASCSPNRVPVLKNQEELRKQVSEIILHNMIRLLNGENTLRDLAIKMDKSVFDVTCGLVPYFFKGYLRLVEVPDLPGFSFQGKQL